MTELKHKFNEDIENWVSRQVVDEEYVVSKRNNSSEDINFESLIDMLECKRTEKDYDWMSDIFIPEMPSIILTDASGWANQYFQNRDFVEVKLDGTDPDDKLKCKAAKRCINQTLNRKELHYYQKYMRARTINDLAGQVYMVGWWEQETKPKIVGYKTEYEKMDIDILGNAIVDPMTQEPALMPKKVPVEGYEILKDHFNCDVVDPRNVFTDTKYCYSIQEKDWVTIRTEKTYEDLKKLEEKHGYFNLDLVKGLVESQGKTDASRETYDKDRPGDQTRKSVQKTFDVLLRFGKFWAIVEESTEDGRPIKIKPGYDSDGKVSEKAEIFNTIIEEVISGSHRILIRFQPNGFRDSKGNNYYPIIRGWCYIHPTKDVGLSDGKYLKELQIAINDHFNMGSDRVKLATLPTLIGEKFAIEDNTTIYFAPEHTMEVPGGKKNLEEFKISDNIDGTINMIGMLQKSGQKAVAIYPTTMGELPAQSSTTATAIAGAESRTTQRGSYKSLTYDYTFLLDLYWIILQMTYQFALPETALKMMGDSAEHFDPDADYNYTPVSSNIETEYNKYQKIKLYDQTLGRISGLVQTVPAILPVIAHILQRQLELQGDEYQDIGAMIQKLAGGQVLQTGGNGAAGQPLPNQMTDMGNAPVSNQNQIPMSGIEGAMRDKFGGMM